MPILRDTLVFKGGTPLKRCFFSDYRFSEDLDFTGVHGVPTGRAMQEAIFGASAIKFYHKPFRRIIHAIDCSLQRCNKPIN